MPVGTTAAVVGSLMLAGGAMSASSSIMGANAQSKAIKKQTEYNAQVYEQQAEMVKRQKQIQDYQFLRSSNAVRGAITSRTAGKGLMLSGSPLAILADTESQMLFDKAIEDYNLDVQANYADSAAKYQRTSGAINSRLAKYSGYSNAFSTMLGTASNIGLMNMNYRSAKGSTP